MRMRMKWKGTGTTAVHGRAEVCVTRSTAFSHPRGDSVALPSFYALKLSAAARAMFGS